MQTAETNPAEGKGWKVFIDRGNGLVRSDVELDRPVEEIFVHWSTIDHRIQKMEIWHDCMFVSEYDPQAARAAKEAQLAGLETARANRKRVQKEGSPVAVKKEKKVAPPPVVGSNAPSMFEDPTRQNTPGLKFACAFFRALMESGSGAAYFDKTELTLEFFESISSLVTTEGKFVSWKKQRGRGTKVLIAVADTFEKCGELIRKEFGE